MLRGRDLSLVYSDGTGIRSVSVSVELGESKVIVGPSGSGKTTLLRVLCLLEFPQTGILDVDGLVYEFPRDLRNNLTFPYPQVTMVFQQLFLWPHMKNRTNLELPLQTVSQKKRLGELVERLDIGAFIDKYPNQSSVGQRQRIAIARAFALLPEYILIDEATSALDWELTQIVAEIIVDANGEGVGIIVVTHDPGFAELIADSVLRIERGAFVC